MGMKSAHGTTNGSAYAIWWAMLCGTSTQTDRGCTRCPIFMRSLRSQPLSSALRLKNNTREQHECTNLMHSDLETAHATEWRPSIPPPPPPPHSPHARLAGIGHHSRVNHVQSGGGGPSISLLPNAWARPESPQR